MFKDMRNIKFILVATFLLFFSFEGNTQNDVFGGFNVLSGNLKVYSLANGDMKLLFINNQGKVDTVSRDMVLTKQCIIIDTVANTISDTCLNIVFSINSSTSFWEDYNYGISAIDNKPIFTTNENLTTVCGEAKTTLIPMLAYGADTSLIEGYVCVTEDSINNLIIIQGIGYFEGLGMVGGFQQINLTINPVNGNQILSDLQYDGITEAGDTINSIDLTVVSATRDAAITLSSFSDLESAVNIMAGDGSTISKGIIVRDDEISIRDFQADTTYYTFPFTFGNEGDVLALASNKDLEWVTNGDTYWNNAEGGVYLDTAQGWSQVWVTDFYSIGDYGQLTNGLLEPVPSLYLPAMFALTQRYGGSVGLAIVDLSTVGGDSAKIQLGLSVGADFSGYEFYPESKKINISTDSTIIINSPTMRVGNDSSSFSMYVGGKSLTIDPFPPGAIDVLDGAYFNNLYADSSKIQTLGIYINSVGDTIVNASYVDFNELVSRGMDINYERAELYNVSLSSGLYRVVHATDTTAGISILNSRGYQTFEIDSFGIAKLSIDTTYIINIPSKGINKVLTDIDGLGTVEFVDHNMFTTLTDDTNIAWDLENVQTSAVVLGGNRTLDNPINGVVGKTYKLIVQQDVTGTRTLAYGTDYLFPGGTAPTVTATTLAVSVLECLYYNSKMHCTFDLDFQ